MKKVLGFGLLSGVVMLIVGIASSWIFELLFTLKVEYQNPAIFRPWTDPLMSLYFVYPFLLGVILAWAWDKVKILNWGQNAWKAGLKFGWVGFIVLIIPGMFMSYSTFVVSFPMILSWAIGGFLQLIFAGWVFAKLNPGGVQM